MTLAGETLRPSTGEHFNVYNQRRTAVGTLTDDMTRLSDEIGALRNGRRELMEEQRAFAQSSKEAVASLLATWNAARAQASEELRTELRTGHADRAALVRDESAANEAERLAEADRLQQARAAFVAKVCGRVEELKAEVDVLRVVFQAAHDEMAEAQRETFAECDSSRRDEEARRIEEASQDFATRTEILDGLRAHVNALREAVSADLAGVRQAWAGTAAPVKAETRQSAPAVSAPRPEAKAPDTAPVKTKAKAAGKPAKPEARRGRK
jgi:chromosome segregation ATPase